MDYGRLSLPVGEAMFTMRAVRRFRPDPIPVGDLELVMEAAVRAPSGSNRQPARFVLVTDRAAIEAFAGVYREAWWAKRHDEGFESFADLPDQFHPAAQLADTIGGVPCIVLAFGAQHAPADSVIPAVQNLMLAARALGIGSVPTTLHDSVMPRFYAMFGVPDDAEFYFSVPLGYPQGRFGPITRRPTSETCYLNTWQHPVPWR